MKVNFLLSAFLILTTLFVSATPIPPAFSADSWGNVEPTEEWQEYTTIDNIRIEYKRALCIPENDREQNLILFRFTNLTNEVKTLSWSLKMWRNEQCMNCENISNPEFAHSITLQSNEIVEADGSTKSIKSVYIFDNYVKFVPGMQDQRLTNFELVDLNVQ